MAAFFDGAPMLVCVLQPRAASGAGLGAGQVAWKQAVVALFGVLVQQIANMRLEKFNNHLRLVTRVI